MRLSPDCKNTSLGFMCCFCGKCGRGFEWRRDKPVEPITAYNNNYCHIIKASTNDHEGVKEIAKEQRKV